MKRRADITHGVVTWKVLTLPEVSEYLRVSRQTIYRMLRRGDIPAFRLGGDWRFNIEDLGHWIEKESQACESEHPQRRITVRS
jgi:excisionase family DNA binding protein